MSDSARPLRDAGIVSRSMAAVVDLVVVLVLMGGGYLTVAFVKFAFDARTFTFPEVPWIFTTTGFFVACVVYLFACWSITERSVGYAVLGLRVSNSKGGRVRVPRLFLRAVFCVLFPVGLAWVGLSPRRRSLQDLVLWTRVVYAG
ncbi:RDD family protein [Gordonia sp. HY002]|uniref:RDD family protein n=1 Tax=Gordonia zhenghanii TaxID=2911516 RepID=UPI001EEF7C28|nr:RDD family protein [Gordonia zhenghanii]MCF8568795.1 RDD family protein [Gordonia zhenghanii]MCF8607963.1 RDD family protein [Gordonia zhenghanii]